MRKGGTLFNSVVLALLAAIAGGAAWSGNASAQIAGTWITALVPIMGTVSGQPESVAFSGQAQIDSKLALDPEFNRPSLVLTIDLSGVSGVGSSSRAKYVISGPERTQRGVAATHLIEIVFPFAKSGSMSPGTARSGVASFALSFDVNTGAVTAATAAVTSPR